MRKRNSLMRWGAFAALLAACLTMLALERRGPRAAAQAGGRTTPPPATDDNDPQVAALRRLQADSATPVRVTSSPTATTTARRTRATTPGR